MDCSTTVAPGIVGGHKGMRVVGVAEDGVDGGGGMLAAGVTSAGGGGGGGASKPLASTNVETPSITRR